MMMTDLVPELFLAPLRWLGQHDWLTYRPIQSSDKFHRSRAAITPPKIMPLDVRRFVQYMRSYPLLMHRWHYLYGLSKALASGPKLIRPTYEQCTALANCEANLPFADYEQPYPVVIVELPPQWQHEQGEQLMQHQGDIPGGWTKPPKYVVAFHDKENGYLRIDVVADAERGFDWYNVISPLHQGHTIEESLNAESPESGPDLDQALINERLAVNLCLMMTCYGVRDAGPLHLKTPKTRRKRAEKNREQERAKMLARNVSLLEFNQKVMFFNQHESPVDEREGEIGTHASPRPHWRRGHFRRVPWGQGRAARKLVFIRPTLVSRRFFAGDIGDTTTTYEGRTMA